MKTRPENFLQAIKPFREDLVVSAECMFAWYWLADLCEDNNIPFILGHALYMRAIHGGKSKNERCILESKRLKAAEQAFHRQNISLKALHETSLGLIDKLDIDG